MFEVTDVFTVLEWLLLCGNVAVIALAALIEFGPRHPKSADGPFELAVLTSRAKGHESNNGLAG